MKTFIPTVVLTCFISIASFAQNELPSQNTSTLFNEVKHKLSTQEQNTIASLSQLMFDADNQSFYKQTDANKQALEVSLYVFDLTSDGTEEIGIIYQPKESTDKKEVASMLFVKDKNGNYQLNIDIPGRFYFLDMNTLVFPDVYIRNYEVGLPVYRWDGNQYNKHKPLKPGKLKKYTVADMAQASRLYSGTSVGE